MGRSANWTFTTCKTAPVINTAGRLGVWTGIAPTSVQILTRKPGINYHVRWKRKSKIAFLRLTRDTLCKNGTDKNCFELIEK